MQKITSHFWFDKEAKEATAFYASLFDNSRVNSVQVITDTPSGDCDIVSFTLAGQEFMAISAGPYFKLNPSISLFVTFSSEAEIKATWDKLIEGGKALMPYDTYPWANKYGWLQDKYGLSWQLSWSESQKMPFDGASSTPLTTSQGKQKITPMIMYVGDVAGKTKEAIEMYVSIFPDSKTEVLVPYEKSEGEKEGFIKHLRFVLAGQNFMAMDSSLKHEFGFNEAFSFIVNCETQEEIDHYWEKLSAVPEAEQCGWLKDKYGVSWQIVPAAMNEMMKSGDKEKTARVTQAFLKMKKFDIATLKKAYEGK